MKINLRLTNSINEKKHCEWVFSIKSMFAKGIVQKDMLNSAPILSQKKKKNMTWQSETIENNFFQCKKKIEKVSENFKDFVFLEILVMQAF